MTSSAPLPVLVAVDGSESATAAVRWAAGEAARTAAPLRVITVYSWPVMGFSESTDAGRELLGRLRAEAARTVGAAARAAAEAEPGLVVSHAVRAGDPVEVLRDASADAALLVLGSRGLGGVAALLLGSTAVAMVAHAHCPVVVVRGGVPTPRTGRVLAGLDGGPGDEAVLRFAFEHATATGATVAAAHCWSDTFLDAAYAADYASYDWGPLARRARDLVAGEVAPWRAKHPDVPVEQVVMRTSPTRLLLDQALDAELVVVGARGRGGF
ncbi:universal stress protein, partial [Actinokineospora sp. PR83]|uniref:universal stress protein n=1 Tax=Actinokineospora sp. PR83 TaxID=2884908 RepID=UPI001F26C9BC